ncbi:hypothetical protein SAMN04487950_4630 [Halogranum rubrum]|uniref:Uncharacterized protein n=1 Tax=Halogranum rubrum TaxID=553466 RepID=A0A1I4JSD0_9EURY|nr:hypothetical protein [Halogranum rubrum]SFL69430.1 hypothetical protein SAMN04487950_4630 [Halogranum rubrum]
MGVEVGVVGIKHQTEYQGTVFDQSVVVRLPDGSKMGLFDKDVLVSDGLVGSECIIAISTLSTVSGVEEYSNQKGIEPTPVDPEGWSDHTYCGEVVGLLESTDSSYKVQFDVGCGDIIAYLDRDQFDDSPIGCLLRIKAMRSDISGVLGSLD